MKNPHQERSELIERLKLINVASPGRDKLLLKLRELDVAIKVDFEASVWPQERSEITDKVNNHT
ncbi:hypothetical protein WMW72_10710 [Paenibacillus filicis]|uniref:Uncharacterized protein n=1 Tax=Paenibacillus filicis TaxID=669464 RepID=A0ABU9DHM8_9BACL